MRARKPDRMDAIAGVLKWMIGIVMATVAVFFVWARIQQERYFVENPLPVDQGNSIVFKSFGLSSQRIIDNLGEPFDVRDLRENEQLIYWNFDPVTLEIHFHKDKALRMAYFCNGDELRKDLTRRIFLLYGDETDWEERESADGGQEKRVNVGAQRTLVEDAKGIYLYGYILK